MKNKKIANPWERRDFLEFLGKSSMAGILLSTPFLSSCQSLFRGGANGLSPSRKDEVELIEGLNYRILLEAGDSIGKNELFGYNNDYIAFLPKNENEAHLWVNHETVTPFLLNGRARGSTPTRKQFQQEARMVGGSYTKLIKKDGQWIADKNSKDNFSLNGLSRIPFAKGEKIRGAKSAIGTLANCSGGVTPWGSILTCEENYRYFVGEVSFDKDGQRTMNSQVNAYKWDKHHKVPPEHYGWVVEVDPNKKTAKKLTALGRFEHEGACVVKSKSGRLVVYMGDDSPNQCIYKFISKSKNSLEVGELFVADFQRKKWVSLDRNKSLLLQSEFKSQQDVLIRTREAAALMGGTPMNRPEDIERDPLTGDIIVALTNNALENDYHGQLLKIREKNNDCMAMDFESETLLAGGEKNGFACPDNLVFAPNGDLWFTVDIAEEKMNTDEYKAFGNNALYHVPRKGSYAGEAIRVANAPIDAEFTGPYFSPDGHTLFLSVQHPGRMSSETNGLTSHWPHGGDNKPKPAVIAITGPYLSQK